MWLAVMIFNPVISLLSLAMLPLVALRGVPEDLLAQMGQESSGAWLGVLVSVDAVLVLSGAVLTSFVGVTGLMRRMALDRCLPQFLLRENRRRRTSHWIILLFFVICCAILMVLVGFFAVALALLGNVLLHPDSLGVVLSYAGVFGGAVLLMFLRIQLLKLALLFIRAFLERLRLATNWIQNVVGGKISQIVGHPVIYFTRGDNIVLLNRCALYVMENEQTNCLKVVHVYSETEPTPPQLAQHLHVIDRLYPDLRIDFLAVKGKFGPEFIDRLSRRLHVPKNYMFIGTPGDHFPHRIEALGGVRVIL